MEEVRAAQRESNRIKREQAPLDQFGKKLESAQANLLDEARRWDEDVARFRNRKSSDSVATSGTIGFDDTRPKSKSGSAR